MSKSENSPTQTAGEQPDRQTADIRSALQRALRGQQGDVSPAVLIGLAYGGLPAGAELDDVLPVAREVAESGVTR